MRRIILTLTVVAAVIMTAATTAKTPARTGKKQPKTTRTIKKKPQTAPKPEPEEWVLVNVAAACMRTEPAHASQLETQASYGTPAKVLSRSGEWYRLQLPDGYRSWMAGSSVVDITGEQFSEWKKSDRLIVTQPRPTAAYSDSINISDGNIAFDVVIGSIFRGNKTPGAAFTQVTLPDGRNGFMRSSDLEDFATWSRKAPQIDTIMNTARSMMGITYLWGGTTPKAIDCSGFTKVCFAAAGIILPRNASQQALAGEKLDHTNPDTFRQGDLLFFGTGTGTVVTHVAVYDGFTRYLHASGRVFESSFKASHPLYLPRKIIGACRILGIESPKDVTTYAAHPWYF
ncbi:MAG: C40 family peptidase [Paramuribaculum sp.]|nr:C40 family peptidase [Paramuribaculum sp.]